MDLGELIYRRTTFTMLQAFLALSGMNAAAEACEPSIVALDELIDRAMETISACSSAAG